METPPNSTPPPAGEPGAQPLEAVRKIEIGQIEANQGAQVNIAGGDLTQNIQYIYQTILPAAEAQDIENLPPEPGEAPYPGLKYFTEEDAGHFFGREMLAARIANRLSQAPFLAIIGASGSGKSSLLRAGVLPALRSGERLADGSFPPADSPHWDLRLFVPGARPLEALAACLLPQAESVSAQLSLQRDLAQEPRALALTTRRLLAQSSKKRLLLVIDQFEEIFTQCRQPEERQSLIENLLAATDPAEPQPVSILVSLRADFYAQLAGHDRLRERISQNQEFIGAMNREEKTRAILLPAQRGNWKLQEGLVEVLLDDLGDEPGALPLLSHALLETWKRRRGRVLTLSGYTESGGIHGAIAQTAESVFLQRLTPEQQTVARMIFIRLTSLSENAEDTRRRITFTELLTRSTDELLIQMVLNILAEARLITIAGSENEPTVEVAHEALIREWPTLRQWLSQDHAGLLLHRQLTEDASAWLKLQRDPGSLYRGLQLQQVQEWAERNPADLNRSEQEFLEASRQALAQEQAANAAQALQLTSARRLQWGLGGLAAVLVIAVILVGLAANGFFAPRRMNGIYNIAVAEFGYVGPDGKTGKMPGGEAQQMNEWVANYLQVSFTNDPNILIWPNSQRTRLAAITGSTLAERSAAAAALAAEIKADMLIYGVVDASQQPAQLRLEFWLAPQLQYNYEDLRGSYQAGAPIRIPDLSDPGLAVQGQLGRQSEALAYIAMGLVQVQLGESEQALAAFEKAGGSAPTSPQVQFFIGRENLFRSDQDTLDLEERIAAEQAAGQAFERSIRLDPDYARSYIGLGSVALRQAQRLWSAGPQDAATADGILSLLVQAQANYQKVLDLQARAADYGVPIAELGNIGLASVARFRGSIYTITGELERAAADFAEAIQALEDALPSLAELVQTQETQRRYLAQAYEYLGESYQWQGYLFYAGGKLEQARASYQQAIDYYDLCSAQAKNSADLIIQEDIVAKRCIPFAQDAQNSLVQLAGGP